ncbi:MAG TPA: magnesium transporter, partial [Thermodesulfobacteriota bacterium]
MTIDLSPDAAPIRPSELADAWPVLSLEERLEGFRLLPRPEAEDFFLGLPARDQAELLLALPASDRRSWIRLVPPDDAADVIQASPPEHRDGLLALLDWTTRVEVTALLAYAEDAAGGLMNPRYARLRPEMTVDEAIRYLRRQVREQLGTIYYLYVIDADQRLLGVASLHQLFAAPPERKVRDIMRTDVVTVPEQMDQEAVSRLFAQHDLIAIPVVDAEGRMKGIVTVDDIVDVVQEEATEDIQKIGGTEALEAPYLEVGFGELLRKRAGWLSVLFLGEMLTASAMAGFEDEIARAVVLALFVPLIISSGGNSGSQASTLVIRAMALGEVKLRNWWRVLRREALSGLALG